MIKCKSKITSMVLALVMLASLIVVPASAQATELNEITGFIWDVNSITGIKFANSYEDATNVQAVLAVYENQELKTVTVKDVTTNFKTAVFDTPAVLSAGQTAKAFLWNSLTVEPLAKSYPVTDEGVVDSNCQVVGIQKVILPADNATIKSNISYALYDSELKENVSAKFTLTGTDLTGLSITEDGVLTTTPQAKAGTVFVNAQYGCKVYQKELTLVKGYYENFEGYNVNDNPSHNDKVLTIMQESSNGNKYVTSPASGSPRINFANDLTSDNVTFEYDVLVSDINSIARNTMQIANGVKANGGTLYYLALDFTDSAGKLLIRRQYKQDGTSSSYPYEKFGTYDFGWINIRYILHCDRNTFDLYINDNLVASEWRVREDIDQSTFIGYIPLSNIDNVNIYSGTSYDPYKLEGVSSLVAPANNADFTTSLSFVLKDSDTKNAVSGAKYSLVDSPAGFTMAENGELTVSPAAQAGTITVKATLGGSVYTKEVTVKKGYSENFDSFTTGSEPYQNDNKWANREGSIALKDGSQSDKYLKNAFNANNRYSFGSDIKADVMTIEFETLYTEENMLNASGGTFAENQLQLNTAYNADGGYSFYFNYGARYDKTNDIVNIFTYSTNNYVAQAQLGTWVPTRIVIDFTTNKYDVYVNNELVAENVNVCSDETRVRFEVNTIILGKYVDNINIYSGTKNPSTLYLVGDSIVQNYGDNYPYPIQGWGYYISEYLNDDIVVDNRARSGWDTDNYLYPDGIYDKENGCQEYGSVIYEGDGTTKKTVSQSDYYWENIIDDVKEGDYVIISLGINDNSDKVPQERYVENIETMYNQASAKGAEVLFTTPTINAGSWNSTSAFAENQYWKVYGESCMTFAASENAVCLPLGSELASLYNNLVAEYKKENPDASDKEAYNFVRNHYHIYGASSTNPPEGWDDFGTKTTDDATHFNPTGSKKLAGLIAELIKSSDSSLGKHVK